MMNQMHTTSTPVIEEPTDFSLFLGGPLFQLLRRAHLSGDMLTLVAQRVIVLSLFAWLPLLVLSFVEGRAWGGSANVPFLLDVDVHARLLLALPLLIVAERVVHQRMRLVVPQFVEHGLVPDVARGEFNAAISAALRLRNSIVAEVLMVAIVYLVGTLVIWRKLAAIDVASWSGMMADGKLQPSLAGWWFGWVSLPLFQFILLRWYFRLFIWMRFLWHVSRIELNLVPTHPDRAGGLGILSLIFPAFAPLLMGQGVMLAGVMADKIFFAGARLPDFRFEIAALVTAYVFFVLGPVLVFAPRLVRAKRKGLIEYSALAERYVCEFDQKWLRGGAPPDELLVGSRDIRSLAELANSFKVVEGMRPVPFGKETVLLLVVMTLLPVAPLVLTMIPVDELLDRLLKFLF